MKRKVTTVAYPTIPIVFNSSIRDDRVPLHDTMGLSITDESGEKRTETVVEVDPKGKGLTGFVLDGKPLDILRLKTVEKLVDHFNKLTGNNVGIKITSTNYKIYSGSSDSGAAALTVALNDLFQAGLPQDEIAKLANSVSESAIRAVYGGINILAVTPAPMFFARQVASEEDLKDIKIFGLEFDYESRLSAEEIFQLTRLNPFYQYRLNRIPEWIAQIKLGLLTKDWKRVFENAEDNCHNAHYLVESSGRRCRRKEMMNACIDVEEIRASGLPVYWTAGGGKVINIFSWTPYGDKVEQELIKRGHKPVRYKVAPGAKVVHSE